MKKTLTLILLFVTALTYGQIPKHTSSISITGDSSTKDKIIELLVSNGYSIKNVSDYSIQTEFKRISYDGFLNTWDFDINVSYVKNKYTFTIYWNASNLRGKCSNKGLKSGAYKVGLNELNDIVLKLGYEMTYNQ